MNAIGTFFCAVIVIFVSTSIPYEIINAESHIVITEIGKLRFTGPILIIIGIVGLLMCFWNFIFDAKGTPLPG